MIKVAIVEDHDVLREQFVLLLNRQEGMECTLPVSSLGELFESLVSTPDIDILLLDISLGTLNSLEHLGKITKLLPDTKIIMLTGHKSSDFLVQALQNGAHGYFLKSQDPDLLPVVIRLTMQGGSYMEPSLSGPIPGLLLASARPQTPENPGNSPSATVAPEQWNLNLREQQIMQGLLEGKAYKVIGAELHISINTVRVYVKSLYRKMNVNNRLQLIKKCG